MQSRRGGRRKQQALHCAGIGALRRLFFSRPVRGGGLAADWLRERAGLVLLLLLNSHGPPSSLARRSCVAVAAQLGRRFCTARARHSPPSLLLPHVIANALCTGLGRGQFKFTAAARPRRDRWLLPTNHPAARIPRPRASSSRSRPPRFPSHYHHHAEHHGEHLPTHLRLAAASVLVRLSLCPAATCAPRSLPDGPSDIWPLYRPPLPRARKHVLQHDPPSRLTACAI